MHRRKSERWRASIALLGLLLLLLLMVWAPASASAYTGASGLAVVGQMQATPTIDVTATMTALNEEKLRQEIQQLKNQNEPDLLGWLQTNAAILLAIAGGIFAVVRYFSDREAERKRRAEEQQRWLKNQEAEREKRAEERFQAVVGGLSSEKVEAKIGAAILLRTFLRPGYEQFYIQAFDLAVAHLRIPGESIPADGDPNTPLPLTTLSQVLIVVFREAFPLARSQNKGSPQSLDASGIQLDNAFLNGTDLKQVWIRQASLRKAKLRWADLSGASLLETNLSGAKLRGTDLSGANLVRADLSGAELLETNLSRAELHHANLSRADLSGANLDDALSLKGTNLQGVKGLTREQLEVCKAKGAITDEDTTTDSSQPPVAPSLPSQNSNGQTSSLPSAPTNTPPHPDAQR